MVHGLNSSAKGALADNGDAPFQCDSALVKKNV